MNPASEAEGVMVGMLRMAVVMPRGREDEELAAAEDEGAPDGDKAPLPWPGPAEVKRARTLGAAVLNRKVATRLASDCFSEKANGRRLKKGGGTCEQ